MNFVVVYLLVRNAGGVDGRDPTEKGGEIDGALLQHPKTVDGWHTVRPEAIDLDAVRDAVLKRLTPVEQLALRMPPKGGNTRGR